ncbi:MAG: argininosuccinate lyase [Flavisolibacter sp.]
MKLWQKENTRLSELVEKFTVGKDKEFDLLLARYDIQGSMAHVTMLGEVGMLTQEEVQKLLSGLKTIEQAIDLKGFKIEDHIEDVHSQVEFLLTQEIGEAGKKIHTGRSRNDQVALDIKLYLRQEIINIKQAVKSLFDLLIQQSEKHKDVLLPGYTHLQIAMPSSFGLWFGAYAESLVDDMEVLAAAYAVTNKNPLGSGAGYGSTFPINRGITTKLLGFATPNYNSVYAQMSRGKTEKIMAMAISNIAATLSKLAMDCCLYMSQNLGFISLPEELTTGSSLMPHKKNPDVFELVRARCNRIQAVPNELVLLLNNLPSGYHRDLQLTKEILFPSIEELKNCLEIMVMMLSKIEITKNILDDPKYKYIFSVEAVNALVNKGVPFRDAYREVGNNIQEGKFTSSSSGGLTYSHEGSIGNLCNDQIMEAMQKVLQKI